MSGVRHAKRKGQAVNTRYGLLQLDGQGRVVKIPSGVTKDQLTALPNFLDEELFPLPQPVSKAAQPKVDGSLDLDFTEENSDAQFKSVLTILAEDTKNLNSEGKLDLGKLNSALRTMGLKTISGARRDALMG